MDEKTRLSRLTIGLGASLLLAVVAGAFFGLLGVSFALGAGLLVTIALGGGRGKR
jgi:hypothetical protein